MSHWDVQWICFAVDKYRRIQREKESENDWRSVKASLRFSFLKCSQHIQFASR